MLQFWLALGLILILAEFILPGLVVMFIGLGALTVATALHLNLLTSIYHQLILFFLSSITYCFTLRILLLRFYPHEVEKANLEKALTSIGEEAIAHTDIAPNASGNVLYEQSIWKAKNCGELPIKTGDPVIITNQINISLEVKKKE